MRSRKGISALLFLGMIVALLFAAFASSVIADDDDDDDDDDDSNKAVVSLFVEEFKNSANHDIVDELFSEDFVHHFKDPGLPPGREGMKILGQVVVGGFPDVHVTVEDLFEDDDYVIERTTARATHTGPFNGVPATGNSVVWTEIHIYRFDDGKIAELWSEVDFIALLTQIGAIPGS